MIRLAITDDHPVVIDGLTNALQACTDIQITGLYTHAAELLKGIQKSPADVLLLDLQLPDKNGGELVPVLLKQYPGLRILILSGIESSPAIKDMMQKGCSGYLLKSRTNRALLIEAIRTVYAGTIFLDPILKEELLQEMLIDKRKRSSLDPKITRREKEILKLIVLEYNNRAIAETLCISQRTVETHRYNLMQKLDARNTAGLIRIASQMNLADE